jgi:hypothetical protein
MESENVTGTGVPGVVATPPALKKKGKWSGVKKGTEEYRALDAAEKKQARAVDKAQAELDAQGLRSEIELSRKDIKRILIEDRKIRPHVAEQYIGLVQVAARAHKIPANQFLVRYGLPRTLKALAEPAVELPERSQDIIDGEVLFKNELECGHDFSMFHQPEISFEQFLEQRFNCKNNAMFISKLFEKDFAECHRRWTEEFFPQIDPRELKPNYTQQEARQWLSKQSEHFKTFLLLASRNSFKSSWSKFFVLSLVAAYPDVRVVLVSETHELSTLFAGELRQYLEVLDGEAPNNFLQLFPELAVLAGEGSSMTYENPIRHLRLPAPTIRSTSVDASVTGGRYDLLVADDILSDQSCGNEKQTKATISRFESFWKLGEVGSALTLVLGTPWSETPPDLYKTLKDRAEADTETTIAVRIDPIMQIKPEASKKKIVDLVEEDIERLLFPERLDWRFIRQEIMKNPKDTTFFESQNLVRFVPPAESQWKCNFDETVLRSLVHMQHTYTGLQCTRTILSVDCSHGSVTRYADMSAIVTSKMFHDPRTGKNLFVVWNVDADKYRPAEIAARVVEAARKYSPDTIVIERPPLWEALATLIQQEGMKRSSVIPAHRIYWCLPTTSTLKSKAQRIKMLEPLTESGVLQFVYSPDWNETAIGQLLAFDGVHKSTGQRHDDIPDAISRGVERVLPELLRVPPPQKSEAELQAEAAEMGRQMLAAQHGWIFGSEQGQLPQPRQSEPEPVSATERYFGGLVRR